MSAICNHFFDIGSGKDCGPPGFGFFKAWLRCPMVFETSSWLVVQSLCREKRSPALRGRNRTRDILADGAPMAPVASSRRLGLGPSISGGHWTPAPGLKKSFFNSLPLKPCSAIASGLSQRVRYIYLLILASGHQMLTLKWLLIAVTWPINSRATVGMSLRDNFGSFDLDGIDQLLLNRMNHFLTNPGEDRFASRLCEAVAAPRPGWAGHHWP